MELLLVLGFTLVMLTVGLVIGGSIERAHFRRLGEREQANRAVLVTQLKSFPGGVDTSLTPQALFDEAVISSDYLKSFLGGIRMFFGGELRGYHSLLERARREALARVVEQAQLLGFNALCNVRYETADMGGSTNPKQKVVFVAIIVSATAYKRPALTTQ